MIKRIIVQITALGFVAMIFTFVLPYGIVQAADVYTRYDIKADKVDPGYPKAMNSKTWPGVWSNGIDAAINWGNGKAYFFPLEK